MLPWSSSRWCLAVLLGLLFVNAVAADEAQDALKEGDRLLTAGKYREAIDAYDRAATLDPMLMLAFTGQSIAYRNLGELDRAVMQATVAVRLAPTAPHPLVTRALAYVRLKKLDLALADYDEALRTNPKFAPAYYYRADLHQQQGDWKAALGDYNQAIALNPKDASYYRGRAKLWDSRNESKNAIRDYESALRVNPKDVGALIGKGLMHRKLEHYDEAIKDYTEAMRLNPRSVVALNYRAYARMCQGKLEAAIADLDNCLELSPKYAFALVNRGRCALRTGQADAAREFFARAIDANSKFALAYLYRAQALSQLGREDESRADRERALALDPRVKLPDDRLATNRENIEKVHSAARASIPVPIPTPGQQKPVLVLNAGGHTALIRKLLFTPDSKRLISVSEDKTIRLWSVATGEALQVIRLPIGPGSQGELYAAALSPDGRLLAVGGYGPGDSRDVQIVGQIALVDLSSGRLQKILRGHQNSVAALAFSPDGALLASSGYDNAVRLWDVQSGTARAEWKGHAGHVKGLAFSPDGKRVATASTDKTCRIWSVADGSVLVQVLPHDADPRVLAWSPDGQAVASGAVNGSLAIWDSTGKVLRKWEKLPSSISDLAFSPDSQRLLVAFGAPTLVPPMVVDWTKDQVLLKITQHNNTVTAATFDSTGQLDATAGGDDNEIFIWQAGTGKTLQRLAARGRNAWAAGWSRDGQAIAFGNSTPAGTSPTQATTPLERAFDLKEMQPIRLDKAAYQRAAFSNGTLTAKKTGNREISILEADKEIQKIVLNASAEIAHSFCLLDHDRLLLGSVVGIYLIDARTAKVQRRFHGHASNIFAIAPAPDGRHFVTGAMDQTIRIWDLERSEPVLSFFFAGEEWIAWTPEGYYAASAGGEQLMGWQVNNGLDQSPSYFPANQFRKTLYRPDVIKLLLSAGSLERALAQADEERGQASQRVEVSQILPPRVRLLNSFRAGEAVPEGKLEINAAGEARGPHPVTSMRLLIDGRPLGGAEGTRGFRSATPGEVRASWSVDLPAGKHRLAVRADSDVSHATTEETEITVGSNEANAATTGVNNLYLLAIGINAYPGSLKLDCAVPDAKAITDVFEKHARKLFRQVETKQVLDAEATRDNIRAAFDWLKASAKPGDVAVVFYAGHGDCKQSDKFCLLPVDVNVKQLAQTGITIDELRERLQLPCSTVLFLDACFSGSVDVKKKKKRSLTDSADSALRELQFDEGLVIFCGADKDHEAAEEDGHGYFTRALIEGLSGKATPDESGLIDISALQVYAERRVRKLSGGDQNMTIHRDATVRAFPLTKP